MTNSVMHVFVQEEKCLPFVGNPLKFRLISTCKHILDVTEFVPEFQRFYPERRGLFFNQEDKFKRGAIGATRE